MLGQFLVGLRVIHHEVEQYLHDEIDEVMLCEHI
jgi:hypothetical protein